MTTAIRFSEAQIEALAKHLGECGSGSDITRVLSAQGLDDESGESTKWRRLYWVFLNVQRRDRSANAILAFVKSFLEPVRFADRSTDFEIMRSELNRILAFSGLTYGADGQFRKQKAAETLAQAEKRANTIRAKFVGRRIHPEVLKYCQAELMQHNYFHAVFEATKGLAQRIRDLAHVHLDGVELVDRVLFSQEPLASDEYSRDRDRTVAA